MADLTTKDHHKEISIVTSQGIEVFPFGDGDVPDEFPMEDIAHALAMKCRFTGHCRFHYSVAQHSYLMAHMSLEQYTDDNTARLALLHDATEAYLPDVASPLKRALWVQMDGTMVTFKNAEAKLLDRILKYHGIKMVDPVDRKRVEVLDAVMYHQEKWALMPDHPAFQTPLPPTKGVPIIEKESPEFAKRVFLDTAADLGFRG